MPQPLTLALAILAATASWNSFTSAQPLQVMSWNIRYDNAGDGENRWRNRKDWVAEIILREKIDLAGFQEVLAGQYKDLQDRLPEMNAYGVGRDDGKSAGEMVPIFYRKSRFELLDQGTFWLSPTPDKPGSKGWDAALPRITCWLKLKDRETKETFFVLNAHFDHRGNEARRESAALIAKQIREQFAAHPVIFMGDLNSSSNSAAYKTLTSGGDADKPALRDAYIHAKAKEGPDSTWNNFQRIAPGSRIDYLFASENIVFEQLRTLTDQRDGRFPSDHLPVVVKLEMKR
jgi:endonuclease/exonuclease/phosphatase family metal-dependent hydrolase